MRGMIAPAALVFMGCVKPEMGPYDLPPPGWDEPPVLRCEVVSRKTIATDVAEGDVVVQGVGSSAKGKILITALVRDGDRLDLVASSYRCSPKTSD